MIFTRTQIWLLERGFQDHDLLLGSQPIPHRARLRPPPGRDTAAANGKTWNAPSPALRSSPASPAANAAPTRSIGKTKIRLGRAWTESLFADCAFSSSDC